MNYGTIIHAILVNTPVHVKVYKIVIAGTSFFKLVPERFKSTRPH